MTNKPLSPREIRELMFDADELRALESKDRRFRRVANKFGKKGAWLREIYLQIWCAAMDSTTFLDLLMKGQLVIDETKLQWKIDPKKDPKQMKKAAKLNT